MDSNLQLVKENIGNYPNFPKEGINFKDIFSVLRNPDAHQALLEILKEKARNLKDNVDMIVGLDARGFLFGPIMASEINVPFVPIRKKGKLPGECYGTDYALEYGTASVEIQREAIQPGKRVLIVDDLLATGGTLAAAVTLLHEAGAKVVECFVIIELAPLNGRKKLPQDAGFTSLIVYDQD